MNSNNIYSILGKLASLTPKEEPKSTAPSLKEYAEVEARGSVLEGVDAVESRLIREFNEGSTGDYSATKARAGKDIGKPGKAFAKIAKSAGERYGSKERGEKVAGAVLAKLRKEDTEVTEVAAPGQEDWIKKNKQHFIDQYGKDKGMEVLYATAWKRHHEANESAEVCDECGMNECNCVHEDAKPDFLDLDHDGDTDEPMKSAAKSSKTEKGEVTRKDGVTTHRRTDLPGYSSDDDEESEEERSKEGKRGRPRKAQTKKPRPTGEKKGRGRPKKSDTGEKTSRDSDPFSSKNVMGHDPFGRVKSTGHKKASGTKVKGSAMSDKAPKGSPEYVKESILESVNFKRMMDETSTSLEEMLASLNKDMNEFKLTGKMSETLRDFMHVHHHAKKQMEETLGNLPPSQVPGKQDLLKTPATPAQGFMGKVKDTLGGIKDFVTGKPENPNRPTLEDPALEEELNELARLAGLSTEGNAFTGKLKDTPKGGKFELDGKEFTDTSELGEADVEVQEPVKPVNNPKKKYFSLRNSTLAPGEGDSGEKNMYGGQGDNPMTQPPKRPAKPVISLEAKLAQEYESIKKSK